MPPKTLAWCPSLSEYKQGFPPFCQNLGYQLPQYRKIPSTTAAHAKKLEAENVSEGTCNSIATTRKNTACLFRVCISTFAIMFQSPSFL